MFVLKLSGIQIALYFYSIDHVTVICSTQYLVDKNIIGAPKMQNLVLHQKGLGDRNSFCSFTLLKAIVSFIIL